MNILPLHPELKQYLKDRKLEKKFTKQTRLFEENPYYPGLGTELLEPKSMRIWSFRIDKKYRVIFIFRSSDTIEIIDINNHYQ